MEQHPKQTHTKTSFQLRHRPAAPISPGYQTRHQFHVLGPNVSPGATTLRIAVSVMSFVLKMSTLPHHCGGLVLVRYSVKKMRMVEMKRPVSSPADVM
jgi:hypothetical protein